MRGWIRRIVLSGWFAVGVSLAVHGGVALIARPTAEAPAIRGPYPISLYEGPGLPGLPGPAGPAAIDPGVVVPAVEPDVAPASVDTLPAWVPSEVRLPDRSAVRCELVARLERQQRIEQALAAARGAAMTTGGGGGGGSGGGGGGGGVTDPLLAAWSAEVEGVFRDAFHVAAAEPDLVAEYLVDFDAVSGRIVGYEPYVSSGNTAYDDAAERAIRSIPAIPPAPPHCRDAVGTRLWVTFEPPD